MEMEVKGGTIPRNARKPSMQFRMGLDTPRVALDCMSEGEGGACSASTATNVCQHSSGHRERPSQNICGKACVTPPPLVQQAIPVECCVSRWQGLAI